MAEEPISGTNANLPTSETSGEEKLREPEEIRHPDGRIEHPRVQYDRREAYVGWALSILGVVALLAPPFFYGIWTILWASEHRQAEIKDMGFPMAQHPSHQLPPEPRLEPLGPPNEENRAIVPPSVLHRQQQLHSYGTTDDPQFVHVPIERAMKQIAGTLPVRSARPTVETADLGLLDSGEPNSGRVLRKVSR
jgi:hypothetical protein